MKKIIVVLFFTFLASNCLAQSEYKLHTKGITPMHRFLQKYVDSAIVIEYFDDQGSGPSSYQILSKTDTFINSFDYRPIDTSYYSLLRLNMKKKFPVVLWNVLGAEKSSFKNRPADINIFFNSVPMPVDTAKKMWADIIKLEPWQLVDDKNYPDCNAVIMDAGYSIMHLITKKEIKTLIYYASYYYDKQCPGNKNRQGINKIRDIFYKNFPKFDDVYQ